MERARWLMQQCVDKGLLQPRWRDTDTEAAVRLFRENWQGGSDFLLEVLAACCGRTMEEVLTLGEGTLWIGDEPGLPEPSLSERKETFLRKLLGSAYRARTLAV